MTEQQPAQAPGPQQPERVPLGPFMLDPQQAQAVRESVERMVRELGQWCSDLIKGLSEAARVVATALAPLAEAMNEHPEWFEVPEDERPVPCRCLCPLQHRNGVCEGETCALTGRRLSGARVSQVGAWGVIEHYDEQDAQADTTGTMLVCGPCAADRRGLLLAVIDCPARPTPLLPALERSAG